MDDIVISILEQVDETIYLSYLENLTAFGPRPTGSDACIAAAEYIYNQFESMGLAVRYHHWNCGGYSSDNVEATINGTDESSDEIYIICAHYDTVSAGPGADDDTSGTVAVLMAALIMSQYNINSTTPSSSWLFLGKNKVFWEVESMQLTQQVKDGTSLVC